MKKKYTKWNKELLRDAVEGSHSIAQVLEKLGLKPAGGNYANLKKNIRLFDLDTSHFTGQAWNRGVYKHFGDLKGKKAIRNIVLMEVGNKCEDCGITSWKEKPLTLELEHIDGDNTNNSRENLKILCPNCHSQTETFRNRKRKP